ncbi:hypothetical protein [Mesobacillus zeae]|uniref:Uncharacterized protein n=1 Tax=Mesobacillus zeae TaxID=1917180 RepID=A0A398BCM5_9BACI|nr:hypothetical protein [Mesobacillus zeae]RID87825.1 hypothetical protein D1970_03015 [Mesobacillus zeae]
MSEYMSILTFISIGFLLVGLFYTSRVVAVQKKAKGNLDESIPEKVQERPYVRNPVFLSYFLFFLIAILFIVYSALVTR